MEGIEGLNTERGFTVECLLHRWIHVVVVHEESRVLLYIDGRLSDQTIDSQRLRNARIRPIIGRLQPDPRDEQRQWIGGIDE